MAQAMSDLEMKALATKAGGVVSHYRTFVTQITRSNDLERVSGAIRAIEEILREFATADLQQHGLKRIRDTLNGYKGTLNTRRQQLTGKSPRTH